MKEGRSATVPMARDDILMFRKIRDLIEPFNDSGVEISYDTHIGRDLEIDSVAVLDLIMEIEDSYDVSFSMNLISEFQTIGDLMEAVHRLKQG